MIFLPGRYGYVMHIWNEVHCTGCVHMFSICTCLAYVYGLDMQMVSICIFLTYADGRHMDILGLCLALSFFSKIRKKVVPDLLESLRHAAAQKHNIYHSVSRAFYYMLCLSPDPWPGAHGQILPLCLFPHCGTLPKTVKYRESRISSKRPSSNSTAWLYVHLLSSWKWWRQGKIIRVTAAGMWFIDFAACHNYFCNYKLDKEKGAL